MRLEGQHAFITGGGSGIGLACARAFLEDGAMVTIAGRSAERLEAALAELAGLPGNAHALSVDIADESSVQAGIEQWHRTRGFGE